MKGLNDTQIVNTIYSGNHVKFIDDENRTVGHLVTFESYDKLKKLLDDFRTENKWYNVEDFYDYLEEKGFTFVMIPLDYNTTLEL